MAGVVFCAVGSWGGVSCNSEEARLKWSYACMFMRTQSVRVPVCVPCSHIYETRTRRHLQASVCLLAHYRLEWLPSRSGDPPVSAFPGLELQVCASTPGFLTWVLGLRLRLPC